MSPQQRNTILAALCFYQQAGMADPAKRDPLIDQIATNDGMALGDAGIDDLCHDLNCDTLTATPPARLVIHVEDGAVTRLTSNTPIECIVADFDIQGADMAAITSLPAEQAPCVPRGDTADVDPERTDAVFSGFDAWRFSRPTAYA